MLTPVPVRSLTVIGVGAAEGVEVDGLDAGGVHRDVAGVAEEPEPASVGGDVDLFGRGCAVEDHRVVAVLALDDVAAVARIPDERVVAGPIRAVSAPRLPSIESSPPEPISVSAPEPPARVSFPSPPSSVVAIVSVKTPFASSTLTASLPSPASR